jgi:hypothetical protein
MNYLKILDDLLLLFWSFAWIAVTYQQAKKSGQASHLRTLVEINARPYLSWHYWYLERVRAYTRGLFRAFAVLAFFLFLGAPILYKSFYRERLVAAALAFVISGLSGVAAGRSDPYEK